MPDVTITVNGKREVRSVETRTLLVHFLREQLGLTGTHVGCDTSQCGACVVHLDGRSVKSCARGRRYRLTGHRKQSIFIRFNNIRKGYSEGKNGSHSYGKTECILGSDGQCGAGLED